MIDQLAFKMAVSLKRSVPNHPSSVEIFKFSIALLLNMLFIILASTGISLLTGHTYELLIGFISFAILRQLTGGLHLKSNLGCVICSTIILSVISLMNYGESLTIAITIIAFGLVCFFAPAGIGSQSRIPEKYYPYMKLAALLMIASNLLILSPVISLSFLVQGVTLILGREVGK